MTAENRMKLKAVAGWTIAVLMAGILFECRTKEHKKLLPVEGVAHESFPVRCKGYRGEITVNTEIQELFEYTREPGNVSFLGGKIFKPVSEDYPDITNVGIPIVLEGDILSEKFNVVILPAKLVDEPDRKEIWMVIMGKITGVARIIMTDQGNNTRVVQDIYIELPDSAVVAMAEQLGVDQQLCKGFDKGLARVQASFDPSINVQELLSHGLRGQMYDMVYERKKSEVIVNASPEKVLEYLENEADIVEALPVAKDGNKCSTQALERGGCNIKIDIMGKKIDAEVFAQRVPEQDCKQVIVVSSDIISRLRMTVESMKDQQRHLYNRADREISTRLSLIFESEIPGQGTPLAMDIIMLFARLEGRMEKFLMDIKNGVENTA